jgi:NAD(P)H-dependent flavin oxidoreductase YrpB (nitropropane dioxygenase family)
MPQIRTTISEMFGIDYPIIGAPMFQVSNEHLAVAVTEAGGLGCISLTNYQTVDQVSDALSRIRERTAKPIGVNIHLSTRVYNSSSPRSAIPHLLLRIFTGAAVRFLRVLSISSMRNGLKNAVWMASSRRGPEQGDTAGK